MQQSLFKGDPWNKCQNKKQVIELIQYDKITHHPSHFYLYLFYDIHLQVVDLCPLSIPFTVTGMFMMIIAVIMLAIYLCFHREVMENLTFMFSSAEKRAMWEEAFNDAKHKLGEEKSTNISFN